MAFCQGIGEIRLDIRDTGGVHHVSRALEMVVQTAVVQVDGAHNGFPVVAAEHLCVDKAGRIFIDFHARPDQGCVMGLGQGVGRLFIRYARQDDGNLHPSLRGKAQGSVQLAVEDQVRRHDVDIVFRPVQNVDIDHLAHPVAVHRGVAVGDHIARSLSRRLCREAQIFSKLRLLLVNVPHLQKQQREALYRLALQHYGSVLPVAEDLFPVDVPVRQIHAAGKGRMSVNDQNFSVVPVVIMGGNKGGDRRKGLAFYAQLFQFLGVTGGQGGKFVGAVVHQADFHPFACLARKDLQDAAPHLPFFNDKILKENKVLRLLKLLEHLFKLVLAQGKIADLGLIIDREAAGQVQVAVKGGRFRAGLFQFLHHLFVLGQGVPGLVHKQTQPVSQRPVAHIHPGVQQKQRPEHGDDHNKNQPGDFGGGVKVAVDQIEHHNNDKNALYDNQVGYILLTQNKCRQHQRHLKE